MNPRISEAIPTENYELKLVFTNGEKGVYDCSGLLNFGVFQELRNINYFRRVRVLHGTVTWPHGQDICPDTLYLDSKKVNQVGDKGHANQGSDSPVLTNDNLNAPPPAWTFNEYDLRRN